MLFFEAGTSSEQLLFQKKNFLVAGIYCEQSLFLIILHNQFHSIYTWKDFSLTIVHSFKYAMVWSDFESLKSFIVEISKQRINFNVGCDTNVTF